ncbi:unnamed protein product [Rotaria sp. Silwood2]|nr:unnamed protein product [Rotaria sp. Silwood2]
MVIGQIVLIMISYIPNTIQRIYLVLTLDFEKSPLRLRMEILSGEVTLLLTTFQSSISFYIYATTGGALFRQTLKELFTRGFFRYCHVIEDSHAEEILELRQMKNTVEV